MGYFVRTIASDAFIPAENLDEAYRILRAINTDPAYEPLKTGWRSGPGKESARFFAWMSENYDQEFDTAQEILEELGFDTQMIEEGLEIHHYDRKTGNEDVFFASIGHLVEKNDSIEWEGENNERYRWLFTGENMIVQEAEIHWNDMEYRHPLR